MSPALDSVLTEAAAVERRSAIRRLLARPMLGQGEDPETYAAVVRHSRAIGTWFGEQTGWQLAVDESAGFVRLHKIAAAPGAGRPARRPTRDPKPLDRRRYTLLCLALAALDDRARQTTLKHLADAVTTHGHDLPDIDPFDATRFSERRAFVDALKLLAALGVIVERDGDADRYAQGGTADVLYDVDDRRLAQLVSAPNSPSMVEGPDELPVESYPDTEEGRRLRARHHVMRRLLDDPVVYYDDLTERERDWLAHSLRFVHDTLEEVGFTVERRAEGLCAVDADREVTDETFPDGNSTVKHAALLLAEELTERGRMGAGPLPDPDAHRHTARLVESYGKRCGWAAAYVEDPALLADRSLALLERFHLVRRVAGGWEPRPAIARYAPAAPGRTLWEEGTT